MSGLGEYLLDVLPTVEDMNGDPVSMAVYGDAIFRPSYTILSRIRDEATEVEHLLNRRCNSNRTSVEMLYGDLFNLFWFLSMQKKIKLKKGGRYAKQICIVAFFLQNCLTCLNGGNCVATMFNTEPPTIEEYLPLNEDITPLKEGGDKVQLSYTYDYGGRCV